MKGLIYRVKRYYKKRVIPYFRKTLGINELEDNIYTLLNSATDITKCSPATGTLRSIQLTSVELLKLVDLICRKENLTYWLDWGTLLGAVRHKGFIPWDDDLDICMPREDYLRAISVFSAFFADKNGFDVQNQKQAETEWMWINYWNAGIHLDIFPIDSFAADRQTSAEELRRIVSERRRAKREPRNDSFKSNESPARRIFYYPLNIWASDRFFEEDFIFPLRELPFEGYSFFVPDQYAGYLTTEYGSYMDYPRSRILIHREISEMPDATGTDLNEIKELLRALQKEVG